MMDTPFTDKYGCVYKYGEFFPMSLSPHFYNDTFAHMFSPLGKEIVEKMGLNWTEFPEYQYKTTLTIKDLPDYIKNVKDSILAEVIECSTCSRGYFINKQELSFLRKHNFPLPRSCPFCRIEDKIKIWVKQLRLIKRECDSCGKEFRTHYTKKEAQKIYCIKCYQQEYY